MDFLVLLEDGADRSPPSMTSAHDPPRGPLAHVNSLPATPFEPAALVRHRHRRTYAELRTQIANNGIGFAATGTVSCARGRRRG